MAQYHEHFSTRTTPQSEPVPGREDEMVVNAAGGWTFRDDKWSRLDRFLILGTEAGTYYLTPQQMTRENARSVMECIAEDGVRIVRRVVEISEAGRAPKNDPALFVLAMCSSVSCGADVETRQAAFEVLPQVARIYTHLSHWKTYIKGFRGWGRGAREALARWYNEKDIDRLAYQVVKYRQRDGWSHRDALRVAHPKPPTEQHDELYHWITQGEYKGAAPMPDLVNGFVLVQSAETVKDVVKCIETYKLPWETIPTEFLGSAYVWDTLLPHLPMTALIRNLTRMTRSGLLAPLCDATKLVVERVTNQEALRRARVHPWQILNAMFTYSQGHGEARSRAVGFHRRGVVSSSDVPTWAPVREIVDALDEAFYLCVPNVEPTGKRILLGLDQSGSMQSAVIVSGMRKAGNRYVPVTGMSTLQAVAAMALLTAKTEDRYVVTGFDYVGQSYYGKGRGCWEIPVSPRQRLDDVLKQLEPDGGTDYTLPITWAMDRRTEFDAIVLYGDEETWAGDSHVAQAIQRYRDKKGIPTKLVVVGMCSTGTRVADPKDPLSLNVVGMDANMPSLVADFIRGE